MLLLSILNVVVILIFLNLVDLVFVKFLPLSLFCKSKLVTFITKYLKDYI